jgi:hypothetical protein
MTCAAKSVDTSTDPSTWGVAQTQCQRQLTALQTCQAGEIGVRWLTGTASGDVGVIYGRVLGGCAKMVDMYAIPGSAKPSVKSYGCKFCTKALKQVGFGFGFGSGDGCGCVVCAAQNKTNRCTRF